MTCMYNNVNGTSLGSKFEPLLQRVGFLGSLEGQPF